MKYRDLDRGDILPASWTDALQEFISTLSSNVKFTMPTTTSVRIPASTGSGQVGIGIDGLWRYRSTNVSASVPSSTPGTYDIFATATANSFSDSPDPDTDATDYNFGLVILTSGGTPSGGGIVGYRKIGELDFDGAAITEVRNLLGGVEPHATSHLPGHSDALNLSADDLTNGTTGTGEIVLADSPTFTGTATAPTQAVDNSTTRLATTAFVINQGYLKSATAAATYAPLASPTFTGTPAAPTASVNTSSTQLATTAFVLNQLATAGTPAMDGTAARGTDTRGARADHVHPTDTSRAPTASPTFTGTAAAAALSATSFGLGLTPIARRSALTNSSGLSAVRSLPNHFTMNDLAKHVLALVSDEQAFGFAA